MNTEFILDQNWNQFLHQNQIGMLLLIAVQHMIISHYACYQFCETKPVMDRYALIFARGKRAEFQLVSKWPLSEYNTCPAVKWASVGV